MRRALPVVRRVLASSAVVAGLVLPTGPPGAARTSGPIALEKVDPIAETTAMAVRSGDPALYVTTQDGTVEALRGDGDPLTVLDVRGLVRSGGERGLLGLVFSPDGERLYVHYTGAAAGETVVEEYELVAGQADPTTRRVLLTLPQPQANHNGGQLAFGPDGYLYLGLGDGGSQGDRGRGHASGGNGQSLDTLLGKILRIDPRPSGGMPYTVPIDNPFTGDDERPEIYVFGLRNPWRFSFDTMTGDLWIADVGQDRWEEATRLELGDIAGANLGWNLFEGTHAYREGPATDVVMPVVETSHADGNCSIAGGYVYRGTAIRSLRGWYLYSDYCNGELEAVKVTSSGAVRRRDLHVELPAVSSFGQDADGELYVLSQRKGVYRIVAA